jgi:hypothetical protein
LEKYIQQENERFFQKFFGDFLNWDDSQNVAA